MPRLFPIERVESDGRVGGRFDLHGVADGEAFVDHGRIVEWEPGRVFAYRYWSTNHGTERAPDNEILLTYRIQALDAATSRLQAMQENLPSTEYQAVMRDSWPQLLARLRDSLQNRD